ncbi:MULTISPECIES: hypothetical protein [Paenibacillus]|uniref:hypothetical protein n=1 Tax=Paenibacillus TaxID=44249 RepID=UPI0003043B4C|nr:MULTISPECIES: hypothetical protein [Paenibacillus]AHM65561.1 hypothetical protein PPSQR21_019130 [Paenibacillus polymyxa SQR-21]AUS26133.1 hypothetical protein C1A50_1960 [Paenibacillus polymyxa]KAF6578798.1 hypothetical protein G9G57_23955 [Paenibacillus sp. EKM211P]KAF6618926.1 hypothetical protein HFE00_06315 [Paenibacillus sp. EKM101P]KAF6624018.1 hypothetical protein HFE03_00175 [Paenibacillus sp. EKM102P]
MLLEPLGFLLFSTLEGVAVFALILSIFKVRMTPYLWQAIFVNLIMNLQSYLLREEFSLSYLVPVINMLLFIFLLATVVKIPIVWSGIMTVTGYFAYAVIQSVLLKAMFGNLPVAELQNGSLKGYLLQVVSAATGLLISFILYRKEIGFSPNFKKLKFKEEYGIVITLIILSLISTSIVLYYSEVWLSMIFFALVSGFFIYYAVGKEYRDD